MIVCAYSTNAEELRTGPLPKRRQVPIGPTRAEKVMAAERLCAMQLPVADWEVMERELEEGQYKDCPPGAVLPGGDVPPGH